MGFISFQCYSCQQVLKVGDDKAGRKAKCFKCGTILTIPVASTVHAPPPAAAESKGPPPVPPAPARPTQTPMPPGVIVAQIIEPGKKPARPPVAEVAEVAEFADEYDDYDDEEERRPRRRRRPRDEEDEYEDDYEDRPARKMSQGSRWRKVRVGLLLVFIGACVYAAGYGVQEIGVLITHLSSFSTLSAASGFQAGSVVMRIGIVVMFGATIASVVGYVFGLFAPNKYGSQGLIIATLATAGVGVLLWIPFRLVGVNLFSDLPAGIRLGGFLSHLSAGPWTRVIFLRLMPGQFVVEILVDACLLTPFILMPLYLRALARARKDRGLAEDCMRLMIFSSCAIGFNLLYPLLVLPFMYGTDPNMLRVLSWVMWILHYINVGLFGMMLAWYLRTLAQARDLAER